MQFPPSGAALGPVSSFDAVAVVSSAPPPFLSQRTVARLVSMLRLQAACFQIVSGFLINLYGGSLSRIAWVGGGYGGRICRIAFSVSSARQQRGRGGL
jgi:hypothetical protein